MESKNATRGFVQPFEESSMQCLVHSPQATLTFQRTSMAREGVPGNMFFKESKNATHPGKFWQQHVSPSIEVRPLISAASFCLVLDDPPIIKVSRAKEMCELRFCFPSGAADGHI